MTLFVHSYVTKDEISVAIKFGGLHTPLVRKPTILIAVTIGYLLLAGISESKRNSFASHGYNRRLLRNVNFDQSSDELWSKEVVPNPNSWERGTCGMYVKTDDISLFNRSNRISNGQAAKPSDYPSHVHIDDGRYSCGGTIISKRLILTAAHFFGDSNEDNEGYQVARVNPSYTIPSESLLESIFSFIISSKSYRGVKLCVPENYKLGIPNRPPYMI